MPGADSSAEPSCLYVRNERKVLPVVAVLVDNQRPRPRSSNLQAAARLRAVPAPRLHPSVYRRRRLLAAGLLLLAIAAVLVTVQSALAGTGGGPLTTTGAAAAGAMEPAGAQEWVVRPGDTLWSIALALDPKGDVRPLVHRLSAELGGATVYPGEVIPLPALGSH